MGILLLKRLGMMLLVMLVVAFLLFLANEGDPYSIARGVLGPYAQQEQLTIWLQEHGYDKPILVRFLEWLGRVVTGDLGVSVQYKRPVAEIFWSRLGNTGILAAATFAIMVPMALILGVLAGMKEGSFLDRFISVLSIGTTSVPEYASAVLLSVIFVYSLDLLPGSSAMSNGFDIMQLILPTMVLVLYGFGYIARMTRASMAEVMTTHYIRTAILKGIPYKRVIVKHALRNALIAPFTVIMLQLNWLLSGVVVTEYAFGYKGFGALLLDAALRKDIFVIEACGLAAVFVAVLSQTIGDIGYTLLNPRIRFN
ncbi:ABC transporter permease [Aestuariispira insulae]|uniref:Peptide/nickel transport system permease protein n=1 Tax=Aestuariispira insulae TaxID=1461337 RepID=A0A3D9HND9_9PROT|nr:ABC transporter permease [Aestuariispira insulae]RED51004.1 peptide/nickel transport system permease protein [Aestuariispira insulae]